MKLDKQTIKHVAEVARISLTEQEINEFLPQLKEVMAAFSKISSVNTDDAEPSFQPVKIKNVTREDKIEACLSQDEALKNSKNNKDGYFVGPKAV